MADDDRPVGPVIVRRRLGNELRRLREEANLRLDAVAAELEVSPSKISRIETGHSTAKIWDVRNLLELYGVGDDSRRDEILRWAADAKAQAWWHDEIPESLNYYISLEAEARSVQTYCTPVLHSLLQTEGYARAHLGAVFPDLEDDAIDRLVAVQAGRRRSVLHGHRPLRFHAVVDEAALRRRVGTDAVMQEQLASLLTPRENVELRVRPFTAGTHHAIMSPFSIFAPRIDSDPVVVAVEAAMANSYVERPDEVSRFQNAFAELRDSSLDEDESRRLIGTLIDPS